MHQAGIKRRRRRRIKGGVSVEGSKARGEMMQEVNRIQRRDGNWHEDADDEMRWSKPEQRKETQEIQIPIFPKNGFSTSLVFLFSVLRIAS